MRKFIFGVLAAMTLASPIASAQPFPNRPIRMVVPWPAGGIADVCGRVIAEGMAAALGSPVYVDNRPGASGKIGTEFVAHAAPDGYTMLFSNPSNHTTPAVADPKLGFDPINDFSPILLTSSTTYFLVVSTQSPIKSARELIEVARAKPGQLNYANAGIGSVSHFAIEMFLTQAKINVVSVPYKGEAAAVTDLIANAVQMMFMTGAKPYVDDGRLRALGTTAPEPWFNLPDVPPIAEAGLPGFTFVGWQGLVGPAKMPPEIRDRLNAAGNTALQQPRVRQTLLDAGIKPVGGEPKLIADAISNDMVKFRKVIVDANLKLE
jgi:tripartite-type tricarboxylate transporter receptor subunit TctC